MKNIFKLSLFALAISFFMASSSFACNPYKQRCGPYNGGGNPEEDKQIFDKQDTQQNEESSLEGGNESSATITEEIEMVEKKTEQSEK